MSTLIIKRRIHILTATAGLTLILFLAACGGGGEGGGGGAGGGGSGGEPVDASMLYVADSGLHVIWVFDSARTVNGDVEPSRFLSGPATMLLRPQSLWLDAASDRLYVGNGSGFSILVYNNASTVNGNVAPIRTLSTPVIPLSLWLDTTSDQLYVAHAKAIPGLPVSGLNSGVLIFNNASTANGNVAPSRVLSGTATKLGVPNGLWLDAASDRLYVANGNGSILVFNDASTVDGDLAPSRILSGAATTLADPRSLRLDAASDQLYVVDSATQTILVFDNASTADGNVAPSRALSGAATKLVVPNDLWLDAASDQLFVADSFTESILVFNNASTVDGDVAPSRTLSALGFTLPLARRFSIWVQK